VEEVKATFRTPDNEVMTLVAKIHCVEKKVGKTKEKDKITRGLIIAVFSGHRVAPRVRDLELRHQLCP
jgi:hypothetical protein